ncbi:MAG: hypothetical protein V3573_02935 [Desulfovibrionaceae bacterium]
MRNGGKTPSEALNALVAMARDLPVYPGVEWEDPIWDVTSFQKGDIHKKRSYNLKFLRRNDGKHKGQVMPLGDSFSEFCKSLVRVKQMERNISFDPLQRLLDAARVLFDVMVKSGIEDDLGKLRKRHFALSEEIVLKTYMPATAYRMGKALQDVAKLVDRFNVSESKIGYKSTLKKPSGRDARTSEGQEAGMEKMPSPEIFEALAEISCAPVDTNELIRVRIVDLLVVGGFRIGEVLSLPKECWVEKPQYSDGGAELRDEMTGEQLVSCGIRYWPEKGGEPSIKWIPSHTVPLAIRAVEDLQSHCQLARDRALVLEANPDRVPIADLEGDSGLASSKQIGEAVGRSDVSCFINQLGIKPVQRTSESGEVALFQIVDLEKALHKRCGALQVRRGTGGRVQMLSGSLCVCFYNQFKSSVGSFKFIAELINEQHISDFLGGKSGRASAFSRHGFKDSSGRPLRVNTHAFRHWLNTLADHGGLNELQLARWMGRKDIRQNEAYKHATVAQRVEWAKQMIVEGELSGPVSEVYQGLDPVDRDVFLEAHVSTVHFTQFGLCLQDYSVEPCEYHLQCLRGCLHYLRTKGNIRERANLKKLEEVLELQIDRYRDSSGKLANEHDPFLKHSLRQMEGVKAALAVDDQCETFEGEVAHVFENNNGDRGDV